MSSFAGAVNVSGDYHDSVILDSKYISLEYPYICSFSSNSKRAIYIHPLPNTSKKDLTILDTIGRYIITESTLKASKITCAVYSGCDTTIALACSSDPYRDAHTPRGKLLLLDAETLDVRKEITLGTRPDFTSCKFHPKNSDLLFAIFHLLGVDNIVDSRVGLLDARTETLLWSIPGKDVTNYEPPVVLLYSGDCIIFKDIQSNNLCLADTHNGEVLVTHSKQVGGNVVAAICVLPNGKSIAVAFASSSDIVILTGMMLIQTRIIESFPRVEQLMFDGDSIIVWNIKSVQNVRSIVVSRVTADNQRIVYHSGTEMARIHNISSFKDGSGRMIGTLRSKVVVFHPRGAKSYLLSNAIVAAAAGMKRRLVIPEELWKLIIDKFYYR